jgi:ubiquinone/menaquinone biosynthesis C-methylase UbiE
MAEFDEYRDIYHDQINAAIGFSGQTQDHFTRVKADYFVEELTAAFGSATGLRILDVGCGHGDIHPYITRATRDASLTGLDVAASVVEEAKRRHPQNAYLSYDGHRIPFSDGAFDAAFAICVMHHVPPEQWSAFLDEMERVVRPGGVLIVFEHNPLNPLTRRVVNNCPLDENAILLRASDLKERARRAGWSGVRNRFIIFTPFGASLFRKMDRALAWLPLGAQYYTVGRVAR